MIIVKELGIKGWPKGKDDAPVVNIPFIFTQTGFKLVRANVYQSADNG